MGFFDWVMHGLGFEGKEKKDKKSKQVAVKEEDKYANFNLHEKVGEAETQPAQTTMPNFANFGLQTESDVVMSEPRSQKDIQQVVDFLKQGQTVAVNLEGISEADSERILDFLSGAVYGLNASIQRWHGDLFLLAPEGRRILKKE